MAQRLFRAVAILLVPALLLLSLAGCGKPSAGLDYPLESVISKDDGQYSRVYRAENKTVPEVARELAEQREPDEISKEDEKHMFLIYPDEWYHLQQDQEKPSDTLIEVDSKEFVRQNYDPSFLEGFIIASLLDDLFDAHKHATGSYRGYTTRDIYKPGGTYRVPTQQEKRRLLLSPSRERGASSSAATSLPIGVPESVRTAASSKKDGTVHSAIRAGRADYPQV
ncbi:hypothetical protein BSPP4475_06790 [Brevibacillus aydinogluensis]|uniref:DUF4247 domain-containing protein n=1 Tax=Brevibacillus aydinogluensis TaxID=927786 RepID=A0AA48RGR4_9BACL|nr:hypothetical protein BSPP4475_06790 [Brevibacillus aydinogluensis]